MTDTQQRAAEVDDDPFFLGEPLSRRPLKCTDTAKFDAMCAELEQLRADVAALVGYIVEVDDFREQSDGTSWWETELAIRPPEYATEARLRSAVEPILARRRAAQEVQD